MKRISTFGEMVKFRENHCGSQESHLTAKDIEHLQNGGTIALNVLGEYAVFLSLGLNEAKAFFNQQALMAEQDQALLTETE